ncbi:GyrI-like domain-containing protein [Paenibacillus rhizovicinus]|uniref:GyrI-like domain-containing protein n=1 Tax=Paenibacillus rhizovicinus TaxID=2704463 RepID=A0A6C0P7G3_9BACL|nr:GyrI-like domain-containing protein [Paenibacillus rhizovicinus]QHW34341.1 GyrI-like domain-containing protein [Paenibacillus rhizovicinus]
MSTLDDVKEITLPERSYIGMALTSPLAAHEPKRVEQLKKLFIGRRFEIKGLLDSESYVCPSFVCEQLFTYLFCMQVNQLSVVPYGMIGFIIPEQRYVTVRAQGTDPYELLHAYLKAKGLQNNKRGMALEVYRLPKSLWPDEVDVYIPIAK